MSRKHRQRGREPVAPAPATSRRRRIWAAAILVVGLAGVAALLVYQLRKDGAALASRAGSGAATRGRIAGCFRRHGDSARPSAANSSAAGGAATRIMCWRSARWPPMAGWTPPI